jgi:hypothetical protein
MAPSDVLAVVAVLMSGLALGWQIRDAIRAEANVSVNGAPLRVLLPTKEWVVVKLIVTVINTGRQPITVTQASWEFGPTQEEGEHAPKGGVHIVAGLTGVHGPAVMHHRLEGHDSYTWEIDVAEDEPLIAEQRLGRPSAMVVLPRGRTTVAGTWQSVANVRAR